MGFVDAVKALYKNYAKFEGRATRSEYWWPQLYLIILYVIMLAGGAVLGETVGGILALIVMVVVLASFIPLIAVTVRRLHDVDKSGWFYLLGLIPFVGFYILYLCIIKGTDGPNQYGPDSLGSDSSVFN